MRRRDRNREAEDQEQNPLEGRFNRVGCSMRGLVVWLLLGLALTSILWGPLSNRLSGRTQIDYSEFRAQVRAGNVQRVMVTGQEIQGELLEAVQRTTESGETVTYESFLTYLPSFGDDELLSLLESQGVQVETQPPSDFSILDLVVNFLPLIAVIGFGYLIFSQMRSRGQDAFSIFSMRQSQAQLYDRRKERTTFDDVAGLEGPKTELREIIAFLMHPDRFQRLGGEIPTGVLLVGPPGTGKTLLARAVAGEAEVPFFSITGSNFMEMFVGVGASRVRDLFEEAKEASPAIVFIDELDSIGRRRGAGVGGGHDEREQTLNQLLAEMDGFEPHQDVIVMAATNRPDILDRALLRPGRFDRRITVDLPTLEDRRKILEIHAADKVLGGDVDLKRVARGTPGFSGADLENLLNEAALLAAREDKEAVEQEDIEEARDKVTMGLERESVALTDEECELLAYHEGGHAVLAALLPHADPIHKVTIVPRGRAMGVTQQLPERERYVYHRDYMLDRLAVMMGGRASEDVALGTQTSGAESDLLQATNLARKMVLSWGMSKKLGHLAFGGRQEQVFLGEEIAQRREYSEETAREVDEEIRTILDKAYGRATSTLREHRDALDRLAQALLEKEEIAGDEVLEIIGVREPEDEPKVTEDVTEIEPPEDDDSGPEDEDAAA
jgi:cell division protease FtsH